MVDLTQMICAATLGFAGTWLALWPIRASLRANIRAYRLFRLDKEQAENGGPRVPEAELLEAATWGGWFGAKLAQRRFRHKTRKEPFRSKLNQIGITQGAVIALWVPTVVVMVMLSEKNGAQHADGSQFAMGQQEVAALPHRFGPGSAD